MFNNNRVLKLLFLIILVLILSVLLIFIATNRLKSVTLPAEFDSLNFEKQQTLFISFAQNDPSKAWQFLKQKYTVGNQITDDAHSFAHIIGNSAYKKMGIQGIKVCDATFSYGCFHGVTQSMLLDKGKDIIPEIEKSCRQSFDNQIDFLTGCIHGTGHGLFEAENYNLSASLSDCKAFSPDFQNNCFDGVFMEYSENPNLYQDIDFVSVCLESDKDYLVSCSRYVFAVFGNLNNWQTDKIASQCSKIVQTEILQECFSGLGYYAVYQTKGDFSGVVEICNQSNNISNHSYCIIGAVKQLVSQKYLNYSETALKLCQSIKTSSQEICQSYIQTD